MFLLLIDLVMFLVLVLFSLLLSMARWRLYEPLGDQGELGNLAPMDPKIWWAGVRHRGGAAVADDQCMMLEPCHWVFMLTGVGLCCHIPGCFVVCLIHFLAPNALNWEQVRIVAAIGFALLVPAMEMARNHIRHLHKEMASDLAFRDAVHAFVRQRYHYLEDRSRAKELLTNLYLHVAEDMDETYEPTPGGGENAVRDLLKALDRTEPGWRWKLSEQDLSTLDELCNVSGKEP